jgi:ACR3 family arsenite efflux pump ArsB
MIISNGTLALYAMIPIALFYMILMTISHLMGKKLKRDNQVSLVFSTTMRNLTIALGIVMGI